MSAPKTPDADSVSEPVSAFVVTYNEEANIARCLRSLSFCDEVLVIDSYSSDKTVAIAEQLGARVIQREWPGYVKQKAFGLSQVSHEWVLNIDADEEVSPELRRHITQVLASPKPDVVGYEVNRVVYYFDRWWRSGGWYPEFRLRFFRRSHVVWGGRDPHEKPIAKGLTEQLDGELYHYTYRDLTDQISRMHSFSSIAAREMFVAGKRVSLYQLVCNPILRVFKFYFIKKGYREGRIGLIVAIVEGYYTFLKYAKLWELGYYDERSEKIPTEL